MFGMGTGGTLLARITQKGDCELGSLNIDGLAEATLLCKPQSKFYGQAERAISNGKLNVLLRLHIRPINVSSSRPFIAFAWEISSWGRFRAYMHSALILTRLRYSAVPLV